MQLLKTLLRVLNENKARLIQLASRLIGSGLIALASAMGIFQEDNTGDLDNASVVLATFLVGLLLLGLDLLIHRLDRGGVVADNPGKAKNLTKEKRP